MENMKDNSVCVCKKIFPKPVYSKTDSPSLFKTGFSFNFRSQIILRYFFEGNEKKEQSDHSSNF